MTNLLTNLLANKHTSIAGLLYLLTKFGTQVGAVWWPQHKDKLDSTANIIEAAAVAYGLLAAGDSSTSSKDHAASTAAITTLQDAVRTGDTSLLEKSRQPAVQPPK